VDGRAGRTDALGEARSAGEFDAGRDAQEAGGRERTAAQRQVLGRAHEHLMEVLADQSPQREGDAIHGSA